MKFKKREEPKSEGNGSSNYLRVDDGKSVTGVFRGEIFEFYQIWPQGGAKQVFAEPTAGAKRRYKVNFVTIEGGKAVAKVWDFPNSVYNMLADLGEDLGEDVFDNTKFKLTKRGTGKETKWTVVALGQLDDKGLRAIEAVQLNVLDGGVSGPKSETLDDEVPF